MRLSITDQLCFASRSQVNSIRGGFTQAANCGSCIKNHFECLRTVNFHWEIYPIVKEDKRNRSDRLSRGDRIVLLRKSERTRYRQIENQDRREGRRSPLSHLLTLYALDAELQRRRSRTCQRFLATNT